VTVPIAKRHDECVVPDDCANVASLDDHVNCADSVSDDAYHGLSPLLAAAVDVPDDGVLTVDEAAGPDSAPDNEADAVLRSRERVERESRDVGEPCRTERRRHKRRATSRVLRSLAPPPKLPPGYTSAITRTAAYAGTVPTAGPRALPI